MYLSRMVLDVDAAVDDATAALLADGYGVHQLVWSWFGDHADRTRDFLYRVDADRRRVTVICQSAREPSVPPDSAWSTSVQRYAPSITTGAMLAFRLRANPTKRVNGKRVDVVMHARTLAQAEGRDERPVYEAGRAWLAQRLETAGARLGDGLEVAGYLQHRFAPATGGRRAIVLSQLEFDGVLEVVDPERFLDRLRRGLGPAKAFGFGLLLLRPVR